jgi:phosphoglycerate kinase
MADPTLPTIDDLGELAGRRVVVRCDLNVPLDGDRITDDGRIRASLPTLDKLASAGARVVVLAHLGRPKGEPDPQFSLAPVAARLGDLLEHPVRFAARDEVVDDQVLAAVDSMTDGEVLVCENVRFRPEETSKDRAVRAGFAAELAALAGERGAYVDDAFGAVHRAHASVDDVARLLPHAAGGLVTTELGVLRRLTDGPQRPYVVVLGGSKVSDKLAVIDALLPTVDRLLVGGGMCFTFLAAQGHDVGPSLLEADQVDT